MTDTKQCSMCEEVKPVELFHKDKGKKDGLRAACAACTNEKKKKWTARHSRRIGNRVKQWRTNNPEKHNAHRRVEDALKAGKLKRRPCEKCSSFKSEAHHTDYSKPLDVVWLCRRCHIEAHTASLPFKSMARVILHKKQIGALESLLRSFHYVLKENEKITNILVKAEINAMIDREEIEQLKEDLTELEATNEAH